MESKMRFLIWLFITSLTANALAFEDRYTSERWKTFGLSAGIVLAMEDSALDMAYFARLTSLIYNIFIPMTLDSRDADPKFFCRLRLA